MTRTPRSLEHVWAIDSDVEPSTALARPPNDRHSRANSLRAASVAMAQATRSRSSTRREPQGRQRASNAHTPSSRTGARLSASASLGITPEDTLFTCLPLFHTNALNAFVQALVCGAKFVVGSRFSASRFWETLAASEATVTYLLGAMVSILASRDATPFDRAHRVTRALAPATPADLWSTMDERFGIQVVEGHGMTETNGTIGPRDGEQRPGFMGRTIDGFHSRVVDDSGATVSAGNSRRTSCPGGSVTGIRDPLLAQRARHPCGLDRWLVPHRRSCCARPRTAISGSLIGRRTSYDVAARTFQRGRSSRFS